MKKIFLLASLNLLYPLYGAQEPQAPLLSEDIYEKTHVIKSTGDLRNRGTIYWVSYTKFLAHDKFLDALWQQGKPLRVCRCKKTWYGAASEITYDEKQSKEIYDILQAEYLKQKNN